MIESEAEAVLKEPPGGSAAVNKAAFRWMAGAALVLAVFKIVGVWGWDKASDEYQMAAAAWAVSRGETLYDQVWDNHGPLHTVLMAYAFKALDPTCHGILFLFRGFSVLCSLGVAAITWAWARRLRGVENPIFPWLTLVFLLSNLIFSTRGIEIRADNPFNLFWTAALALWFVADRRGRARDWLLAGLTLGACFWFSLKTLTLGCALGLTFIAAMLTRRRWMILPALWFGAGTAVAPALMILALKLNGNLDAFIASFIGQNFDREAEPFMEGVRQIWIGDPLLALAAPVSLAYSAWALARRGAPEEMRWVWVGAAFLILQFLFLIPTRNSQSLLPALPLISVLIAWAALDAAHRFRLPHWLDWRAGAAACVALVAFNAVRVEITRMEFAEDVGNLDERGSCVEPGAWLQDGYGVPLYFPRPTRYKSLVSTLRERARAGSLDLGIERALGERDVKFVVLDERLSDVGEPIRRFLADHYIPMNCRRLLTAGKVLPAAAEGRAVIRVIAAGDYYWMTPGADRSITVDGVFVGPGVVYLADGEHEIRWSGAEPLALGHTPPERWGNWRALLTERIYPSPEDLKDRETIFWPKKKRERRGR